jgi:hypothetical protein
MPHAHAASPANTSPGMTCVYLCLPRLPWPIVAHRGPLPSFVQGTLALAWALVHACWLVRAHYVAVNQHSFAELEGGEVKGSTWDFGCGGMGILNNCMLGWMGL